MMRYDQHLRHFYISIPEKQFLKSLISYKPNRIDCFFEHLVYFLWMPSSSRCADLRGGEPARRRLPAGLRPGQRAVSAGAGVQHQVPHDETVRGRRQGEQLQPGGRRGGPGRVPQRDGGAQAEPAVQLPLQTGHEEGEELPAHLLGDLSVVARLVLFRETEQKKNKNNISESVFCQVCLELFLGRLQKSFPRVSR